MHLVLTPAQMGDMERRFFETTNTPSIDLMENAARVLSREIAARTAPGARIFVACGPGGNGGDGFACARMLLEAGFQVCAVMAAQPKTPDAVLNRARAAECGVRVLRADELPENETPDLWVDALYGTGLSRPLAGDALLLAGRINASGASVCAVDIPSGVSGLSGNALATAVRAAYTVTFQTAKLGHYLSDGLDFTGKLLVRDIGIPESFLPKDAVRLADVRKAVKNPPRNIHKGTRGHLLIIAGSVGMAGAAALCAGAALRAGAGLVTVACPESIVPILQTLEPCAMCAPLPARDGAIAEDAAPGMYALFEGKSAVAVGCGLSARCAPSIVRVCLLCGLPAVFDADALNIIAREKWTYLLQKNHVLTPHPGEARRLLNRELADPLTDALALCAFGSGCTAVYKGAGRIVAGNGEAYVSATGASGMAKGGSGDVFTGIVGSFLADRTNPPTPAHIAAAAEIHGLAGALAQARLGSHAMTARDILTFLPNAFKAYER